MDVVVDLRSDTVTHPTPEMRRAMAHAEVGDAGRGEDPTVAALEAQFAALVGKPAALFVPSGTMANQVALQVLARPGDGVVVGAHQHVVLFEEGGGPAYAGVRWVPVDDASGILDVGDVTRAAQRCRPHATTVLLEDAHMAAGGVPWPLDRLRAVAAVAAAHRLGVHLDGARLWHAAVATGEAVEVHARCSTTVMCCLSKGLGAPVGSLLAGPADLVDEARVVRRRLGGTMRQAGVLAAAGLVALARMRERLAEDHMRAQSLALAVAERWPAIGFDPSSVRTNMVIFTPPDAPGLVTHLRDQGVLVSRLGTDRVRLVTHLDVDDRGIDRARVALARAPV